MYIVCKLYVHTVRTSFIWINGPNSSNNGARIIIIKISGYMYCKITCDSSSDNKGLALIRSYTSGAGKRYSTVYVTCQNIYYEKTV